MNTDNDYVSLHSIAQAMRCNLAWLSHIFSQMGIVVDSAGMVNTNILQHRLSLMVAQKIENLLPKDLDDCRNHLIRKLEKVGIIVKSREGMRGSVFIL